MVVREEGFVEKPGDRLMYEKCVKRIIDIIISVIAIIILSPVFLVLIFLGIVKMKGNPLQHSQVNGHAF